MSSTTDQSTLAAPPVPLLKRLYHRGYSPGERVALNLGVVLIICLSVALVVPYTYPRVHGGEYDLVTWLGIGLASALFMLRRWAPWPVLVGVTAVALLGLVLRLPNAAIFYMALCLYVVVSRSAQRTGMVLGPLFMAMVVAAAIVGGTTPEDSTANVAVGGVAIVLVGWLAGENVRAGRIYRRHELERAAAEEAAAAAEQAERTRRTLADERVTIARELHDIVAHSMSVVAVRSGVARMVLDSRPEEAAEALAIIETTARQSLAEIRMMVSMLRGSGGEPESQLGPLPGLADLDRLISQLASAGVEVGLKVDGAARPLAPAADLTAYRIVQEALTNVVRHAAPTTATVRLSFSADALEIDVANLAAPADATALGSLGPGHGLVGMRERAAMLGGTLEAGPAPEGFRVHTSLRIDG